MISKLNQPWWIIVLTILECQIEKTLTLLTNEMKSIIHSFGVNFYYLISSKNKVLHLVANLEMVFQKIKVNTDSLLMMRNVQCMIS